MILSFSKQQFVDRIKSGIKIHTIREDQHNRWKPGMKVHFWFGNLRNVKSKNKPYHFANGVCEYVDDGVCIFNTKALNTDGDSFYDEKGLMLLPAKSHAVQHYGESSDMIGNLARGDGFDNSRELFAWFNKPRFDGKLIWFKVTEIIQ